MKMIINYLDENIGVTLSILLFVIVVSGAILLILKKKDDWNNKDNKTDCR